MLHIMLIQDEVRMKSDKIDQTYDSERDKQAEEAYNNKRKQI